MNPYAILGALLIWLASMVGVGYWQHGAGEDAQAKEDQAQFDAINQAITRQKAEANDLYRQRQADIIAIEIQRDKFKTQLEKDHAQHRAETESLRNQYAGLRLRFAGETSGCWTNRSGAMPVASDSALPQPAAACELSEAISRSLQQLAFDADQVADDYRLCYDWAQK